MRQLKLFETDYSKDARDFSERSAEERGAVFTRREVVEFILDLAGYTVDRHLFKARLLEPSFGDGDFLIPVVERLLKSYIGAGLDLLHVVENLTDAVRAVELNRESVVKTRAKLLDLLRTYDFSDLDARRLVEAWIIEGDFLLVDLPFSFTHAVGNPPYVRQELIPDPLMVEYRERYATIYDRADLYVPFIERCLRRLQPGGVLGFICADRWMKNKYGGRLRAMIAKDYSLRCYVDMVDTPAFSSDVSAYPAITVIRKEKSGFTRVAQRPKIDKRTLAKLSCAMRADEIPEGSGVTEVAGVAIDGEPWILHSFDKLAIARRLEGMFPTLEDAGCKVGIGVATGADKVYIGKYEELDVEPDRKLPLVKTKDIEGGTVQWRGFGVINPFCSNGALVNLLEYPKLSEYFERHKDSVKKRNCAKKNPKNWYRTIDRIYPDLTHQPKLLIPDIKGDAHIVYEEGRLYPHHNLYYITSETWDLRALQSVLRSGVARLFVSIYSTKMRGGFLRFQAQYLRRIRIPHWKDVSENTRNALSLAAISGNVEASNSAVFDLYGLSCEERTVVIDG